MSMICAIPTGNFKTGASLARSASEPSQSQHEKVGGWENCHMSINRGGKIVGNKI